MEMKESSHKDGVLLLRGFICRQKVLHTDLGPEKKAEIAKGLTIFFFFLGSEHLSVAREGNS